MADEAKLVFLSCSAFQVLVVWHVAGWCRGEDLGPSVDRHWLQALQFSVHLIDLPSTLLRCDGFTGIQKTVDFRAAADQQTVTVTLLLVQVWFGQVLWSCFLVQPVSWLSPVVL